MNADGKLQICTVFYVFDGQKPALIFKSRTQSEHSVALAKHPNAAMAVYSHDSGYELKAGIQMRGNVSRVSNFEEMTRYVDQYSARLAGSREHFDTIPSLLADDTPATLYQFTIEQYKFTDVWADRLDMQYHEGVQG